MYQHLDEVRKHHSMKDLRDVHREAVAAVREMIGSEARIITCLLECERLLVYRFLGYGSLRRYAIEALELSRHRAHACINVARKAAELPAFLESLIRGEITVSKARRVASVITTETCEWWLALLKTASKREIEKAVREVSRGMRRHDEGAEASDDLKSRVTDVPACTGVEELRFPEPSSDNHSEFTQASPAITITGELADKVRQLQAWLAERKQHEVSEEQVLAELIASYRVQMGSDVTQSHATRSEVLRLVR